jgi:hypothetical protein
MTIASNLIDAVRLAVSAVGEDDVLAALQALRARPRPPLRELTIIANAGMHAIPSEHIHGQAYAASEGTLDLGSEASLRATYASILRALAERLREQAWQKIYLIPTGPTTLALQIKLLVYHITRLSTVDLFYANGTYHELSLEYRDYLSRETFSQPQ